MAGFEHPSNLPVARVLDFINWLKEHDFALGIADTLLAVNTLSSPVGAPMGAMRQRLKCLLCRDAQQWQIFDALFYHYWGAGGNGGRPTGLAPGTAFALADEVAANRGDLAPPPATTESRTTGEGVDTPADQMCSEIRDDPGNGPVNDSSGEPSDAAGDIASDRSTGSLAASAAVRFAHTDLSAFANDGEIREAERQARLIALAMRQRLSRRYRQRYRRGRLDLGQTLRQSLKYDGELMCPVYRARPLRSVRIVVFVDVSGSMQHYSRFFLQFVKGLVSQWIDTDVYLYHTHLVRITDALRDRRHDRAMQRVAGLTDGIGGGTNLARSLRQFNLQFARTALNSRTVVFILGDGYDSGEPRDLSLQLGALKRNVKHLVWLNPLLGWSNYKPSNGTMRAALPHLDLFAPANTLASLSRVEPLLARL